MKKVLFGIMALSVAAFAANPGQTADAKTGAETACVPVKVMAEIIDAPTGLVITDEAGTVLDELLLDHGTIIKGKATDDSTTHKIFKVQKYKTDGTEAEVLAGNLNVKVTTGTTTEQNPKAETKLGILGNTAEGAGTLTSSLTLNSKSATQIINQTEYTTKQAAGTIDHTSRIYSTIPKEDLVKDGLTSGVYYSAGDAKLCVTYTPDDWTPTSK